MSWRDALGRVSIGGRQLVAASFRDVPFFVETSERGGGRRVVTKEFPGRDQPFLEDMGRAARTFKMDGYVLGDDYLAQRDALLRALEDSAGPGILVHPYYGTRTVICIAPFGMRETTRDGGMAVFSLDFAETDEKPRSPEPVVDPVQTLSASSAAAWTAVGEDFEGEYDLSGRPGWVAEELAGVLTAATSAVDELLGPAMSDAAELADLRRQLDNIALDAAALARRPADLVDAWTAAFEVVTDASLLERLLDAYDFAPPDRPDADATGTRAVQADAYDSLAWLFRAGVATTAARLAPQADFASYDDALLVRDRLTDIIDELISSAGDDSAAALRQLRADVVDGVPPQDANLERIVSYTSPVPVPALVLCHGLYGDLEREDDILQRNRVPHPVFVRGEQEVLSGD